jgi:deoxyadenosine/deoxycytidine kinase
MSEKKFWQFRTLPNGSAVMIWEGGIGVGKTTVIRSLLDDPLLRTMFDEVIQISEPLKSVTLNAYIKNIPKHALMFQIITLVKRLALYEEALRLATVVERRLILIDRGLGGDQAFECMQVKNHYIDDEGHKIYRAEIGADDGSLEKWKNHQGFTTVYLSCSPETSWRRTIARGIPEEIAGYSLQYMRDLISAHNEMLLDEPSVVVIEWEDDKAVAGEHLPQDCLRNLLDQIEEAG